MTRTALYRHFDAGGCLLYVGVSENLARRDVEHRSTKAWFDKIARTETAWFPSRKDALAAEIAAIAADRPAHNRINRRSALTFVTPDRGIALKDWLSRNGVSQLEFSGHIGVGQASVSKFISGRALPSLATAVLIEAATGGEVKPASWVAPIMPGAA